MENEILEYLDEKLYMIENSIHVNLYPSEKDNENYYKNEFQNLLKISKHYEKYIKILINENNFEDSKFHTIQNPSQKQIILFELNKINNGLIKHYEEENIYEYKEKYNRFLYTLFFMIEIFHTNIHSFNLENIKTDDWKIFDNYWRKIYHFMFK